MPYQRILILTLGLLGNALALNGSDILERTKPHVNVGTINHVDHGETIGVRRANRVLEPVMVDEIDDLNRADQVDYAESLELDAELEEIQYILSPISYLQRIAIHEGGRTVGAGVLTEIIE